MILPETKEKQRITVDVVRTDPDSHQFIVTYGNDGKLYRLPMLLYQKRSTVPDTLPCIIEESFNGGIHLRQDYEILFTLSGIVILVKLVQLRNALLPILVTLSGIVILVKPLQSLNA